MFIALSIGRGALACRRHRFFCGKFADHEKKMANVGCQLLSSTHVDAICHFIDTGIGDYHETARLHYVRVAYADFVYFIETVARNDQTTCLSLIRVVVVDKRDSAWLSLPNLFRVNNRITSVYIDDHVLSDTVLRDVSAVLAQRTRVTDFAVASALDTLTVGAVIQSAEDLGGIQSLEELRSIAYPTCTISELLRYRDVICAARAPLALVAALRPSALIDMTDENKALLKKSALKVCARAQSNRKCRRKVDCKCSHPYHIGTIYMARPTEDASIIYWTWKAREPGRRFEIEALRWLRPSTLAADLTWDSDDGFICHCIRRGVFFDAIEWTDVHMHDGQLPSFFSKCTRLKKLSLTRCNIKG